MLDTHKKLTSTSLAFARVVDFTSFKRFSGPARKMTPRQVQLCQQGNNPNLGLLGLLRLALACVTGFALVNGIINHIPYGIDVTSAAKKAPIVDSCGQPWVTSWIPSHSCQGYQGYFCQVATQKYDNGPGDQTTRTLTKYESRYVGKQIIKAQGPRACTGECIRTVGMHGPAMSYPATQISRDRLYLGIPKYT